ncbi:MAG TPA: response regulator transcription factor [Blastocatellia bacterium]|nr:response regulator transcription factor [Blastocatellia bacterium]HMZ22782.1 response regulator transcription factor [Blastocatellia bacterium]HNG34803.1 response regulator transcription factor [Blastocatellia bacterium]
MNEIRIVIADDHPIYREGLRRVIERDATLRVVAEAGDGEEAVTQIEACRPDVAVLDLDMPKLDGFGVARRLVERRLPAATIFLTMHKDEDAFNEAMNLGAKGYVIKDSAVTDIVLAIRAVAAGEDFISPQLSGYLLRRARRSAELTARKPSLNDLTSAERRVLRLIAENKTTKEIAAELFVSPRTVDHHRANICAKLDLHGINALLKFAIAHQSQLVSDK